jgi:hypothetical protein
MSLFGYSYPPGCSSTPFDDFPPCEVCGLDDYDCICPECPECGQVGCWTCYEEHGLVLSEKQVERQYILKEEQEKETANWKEYAEQEAEAERLAQEYWAELEKHEQKKYNKKYDANGNRVSWE